MTKTNAMRLLETAGVAYRTAEYPWDESDLSGTHVAAAIGMEQGGVFKTLVTRSDKGAVLVFCVPCAAELDLKRAASVAGVKRVELIHVKELLSLTGYVRGGCSPVGMKKKYPTVIDSSALDHAEIAVSAGMRGMQMILSPGALAEAASATFAAITAL